MTQRNFKDWPIDPNTTSGVDLAEILNDAVEAADTNNLGQGRPSYLEPGGLWSKGSSDGGGIDLYMWDGTKDVLIGGSASGDGGMVIADSPPPDPTVGDMWLRTPSMIVFVWNGDYWFQFPEHLGGAGGGGGSLAGGTESGQMTYWDGSAWVPTSAARIHKTGRGPFFDISGEFHIHPQGDEYRKSPWGGIIKSEVYPNFNDKWLNKTVDWNMTWFQPNDDNTNPQRLNGFDFWADRFQIRLSPNPLGDPWDVQDVVFKADGRDVHIGVRDYRAKVHTYGDLYTGMSENFYGEIIPTNPDDKPGTLFSGGMVCLGSYIEGETLQPVNQEERDNPALIRQRAFVRDSGIDMTYNPIYYLPDPDEPQWKNLRDHMPPTMKWLEENSLVANEDGVLVSKGSTEFGDSNDDQHVFHGDVYVGYADSTNLPDTNAGDTVPGTLFLARGVKLVEDPASPGFTPSFNCNNGHVVRLNDDPIGTDCAVTQYYVEVKSLVRQSVVDLYEEQVRQSVRIKNLEDKVGRAVAESNSFDDFKLAMAEALEEMKALRTEIKPLPTLEVER